MRLLAHLHLDIPNNLGVYYKNDAPHAHVSMHRCFASRPRRRSLNRCTRKSPHFHIASQAAVAQPLHPGIAPFPSNEAAIAQTLHPGVALLPSNYRRRSPNRCTRRSPYLQHVCLPSGGVGSCHLLSRCMGPWKTCGSKKRWIGRQK